MRSRQTSPTRHFLTILTMICLLPTLPVTAQETSAELEKVKIEAEQARIEAERARAEAEKARANYFRMRSTPSLTSVEAVPPAAEAQPVLGAHEHDGLFLRMTVGAGAGGYQGTGQVSTQDGLVLDPADNESQAGMSVSVGGRIANNLLLHGDLWFNDYGEKTQEFVTRHVGTVNIGGGVTYYWMPSNYYISGAIGLSIGIMRFPDQWDDYNDREDSVAAGGLGLSLLFGKEWWVSANWALGVACQATYSYTENKEDADLILRAGGVKILFSSTFN